MTLRDRIVNRFRTGSRTRHIDTRTRRSAHRTVAMRNIDETVCLKIDTERIGDFRVVDIRIHANRMHDHIEWNRDRAFNQGIFAFDDELLAIRRYLGDARLDVFDLELFLALPVVLGFVETKGTDIHVIDVYMA